MEHTGWLYGGAVRHGTLAIAVLLGCAAAAGAQTYRANGPIDEREQLTEQLAELENRLAESGSDAGPALRAEIDRVRRRLEDGDFGPGDVIVLQVLGEESLSDTFVVEPPRHLRLPALRPIDLTGVLRSELEPHLQEELSLYLRDPRVRAHSMIRVGVLGAVSRPGFYITPPSTPVMTVFNLAGGLDRRAKIEDVDLRRSGRVVVKSDSVRRAMSSGISLESFGIRPGDEFHVPEGQPPIRTRDYILIASGVLGIGLTILRITGSL